VSRRVAIEAALAVLRGDGVLSILNFDTALQLAVGIVIAAGGILFARYLRSFGRPAQGE